MFTDHKPKVKSKGRWEATTIIAQAFMFANTVIVEVYNSLRVDPSASE
jgi:hypothetical protein